MKFTRPVLVVFSVAMFCLGSTASFATETLTVMTHDSFSVSADVMAQFEKANDVTVRFLKNSDAGATLVQAILSRENPLADVLYGVDNTSLSRALEADIFLPWESPLLSQIMPILDLDKKHRLLPVDYGDVCLNYDKKWFLEHKIAPPTGLDSLIDPAYRSLTVVENPATSSPGLAFLLTTVAHYGDSEEGYLDYWKQLKANDLYIADGWSDAYYGHFTAGSKKGDRPIVVSYASSPAAAVWFSSDKTAAARTAAVTENQSAFRQIEFIGILKGTKKEALARKFVDFILSPPFQEDIPLQMFVFPANKTVKLPEVFVKNTTIAKTPVEISAKAIEENRARWVEAWTNEVLRH
ncbi:thiamine ABC transporter substrate-binding protein [Desulforhopalus vacuolatus]|uniref:thiamine ABC transporter substrate-binding protein n=1 Tax=Desulforhopalus vacuolatus TaxID=40414 RepID=UPI001963BA70|nr:thiamine ABC transporter substrate-binding protein [Desulforhopalus vacuolatus]MBM9518586.1 thiamine ABC transporter substrate-binding protein [Desulforhopalus vacuolatus]